MIYLDNAATSFPKPPSVIKAVTECMQKYCANPGRSGHKLAIDAARIVFETREAVAEFFNAADSRNVLFTANATMAINLVFHAVLQRGDHVVVSSMEHNAVMRPLRYRESQGEISISAASADECGIITKDVSQLILPHTKLVVINHASNVNGAVQDVADLVGTIKKTHPRTAVLIDVSQSAGIVPIDVQAIGCDFAAFTGHKALYGPQGIGGLIVHTSMPLKPFIMGGTGSNSENQHQPDFLPDKFESGTINLPGIAGLAAGIEFVTNRMDDIREKELLYAAMIADKLSMCKNVRLFLNRTFSNQIGIVSFTHDNVAPDSIGQRLNDEFLVYVRTGLHCAPLAHQTLGTYPAGTVRVSTSAFTKKKDIDTLCRAVASISKC